MNISRHNKPFFGLGILIDWQYAELLWLRPQCRLPLPSRFVWSVVRHVAAPPEVVSSALEWDGGFWQRPPQQQQQQQQQQQRQRQRQRQRQQQQQQQQQATTVTTTGTITHQSRFCYAASCPLRNLIKEICISTTLIEQTSRTWKGYRKGKDMCFPSLQFLGGALSSV